MPFLAREGKLIINGKRLSILTTITLMAIVTLSVQAQGGGTSTPTPSPEIFDYPYTPPVEDILPFTLALLESDEGCLLPCFWGFHPGETKIDEIVNFLVSNFRQAPYAINADEREALADLEESSTRGIDIYAAFLPLSTDGGSLEASFGSIDGVLVRIDVQLFMAMNWLEDNPFILSELLGTYGEPTEVYMRYSGAPTIGYVLAIIYEEQGFIVEYGFGNNLSSNEQLMNERITEEERLLVCVEDAIYDSIELIIQPDNNPIPLIETLQPSLDDSSVFRPFWPIEDMTGISIAEFTEVFTGNPDACIEAFSLSELRERGYEDILKN